jgi:Mrp family chromosome partitioning ATPase
MLQELAQEPLVSRVNGRVRRSSALSAHYDALFRQIQGAGLKPSTASTIGIISCAPRAGVSTVALNIAITAAGADSGPVLFIDADVSKPFDGKVVDSVPADGIAEIFSNTAEPLDCVQPSRFSNLSILAGRGKGKHGASSFSPSKFAGLMEVYKSHFNVIIVDIPAPSELNGSILLASELDGVVLVLEAERADGRVALRMKEQLGDAGAHLLGVVLNKRRQYIPGWLYRLL